MLGDARLHAHVVVPDGADAARTRLDVAFALGDGITAVMGHSGAGKTTLLLALAGLVRPSAGRIVLDGTVLFDASQRVCVPPHQRRIGLVFQSLALFPHLSAWENVAYGLPATQHPSQRRERALSWLERARVAHRAAQKPSTLSGGEAQRVALARALAAEPRLLLLDEPFSAMDSALRAELGEALAELLASTRTPALLVTHDGSDAAQLAQHTLHIEAGKLALATHGAARRSREVSRVRT